MPVAFQIKNKKMQLREYQIQQLEFLKKHNKAVVQSPTGTGKSVVMSEYIKWYQSQKPDSRIALITPNQTLNANMYRYLGNQATLAHSGYVPDLSKKILVTTFHSAKKYLPDFKPDLIIGDELHRVGGETYKDCFKYSENYVGFTATPNRADGKPLYPLFQNLHLSPQISWFIEEGYLSDYELISIDCPLFEADSDRYDLQEQIFGSAPEIQKTVDTYIDKGQGKTLIFSSTITHGINLKKKFLENGIKTRFVCSKKSYSDDLGDSLKDFRKGNIDVLINCQMFIEGVDIPQIETLMMCMFTYSTPRYLQIVGRLLRVLPGVKKKLIDLCGNVFYHGSPKTAYYEYNLFGFDSDKKYTNKNSIFHTCFNCETELFKRRYIKEFTSVCCLNCGVEQSIEPPRPPVTYVKLNETSFTLSDYPSETLEALANGVRISNIHWKKNSLDEKCKMICCLSLPDDLKIKLMLKSGADENMMEYYL